MSLKRRPAKVVAISLNTFAESEEDGARRIAPPRRRRTAGGRPGPLRCRQTPRSSAQRPLVICRQRRHEADHCGPASACLALALAGAASSTTFGVADDAGKYAEDGGRRLLHDAHAARDDREPRCGLLGTRRSPTRSSTRPSSIAPIPRRSGAASTSCSRSIRSRRAALVDTPNGIQLFAQYAAKVAERYPYVRKIICLNEGNQPRFHQPQFDEPGNGISGYVQEQAMAAVLRRAQGVDPAST
jgi:hypothetical protein